MGSVDANTGEYIALDQHLVENLDNLPTCALGSGSIPVVFPPQDFKGMKLIDGGSAWNVNIDSAISQCLEIVDSQSDIIVDVFIASHSLGKLEPVPGEPTGKAFQNWNQTRQMRKYYYNMNSITAEERAYPEVDYRYYMYDRSRCPEPSELNFNNSTTWCF